MPPLEPRLEALVERHWQDAQARHRLFNGRVFCADRVGPARLEGHWTEYRRIVAQMAEPALFAHLRIRSVATCGLLHGPDGVAIGRRDAASVYQRGLWQLPPAGSIDQGAAIPGGADWRRALLKELEEELGIGPEHVAALTPLRLVQHPSGVLDLGIRIDTPLQATDILARHAALGDGEYDRMLVLPPDILADTIEDQGGTLVPAARLLLEAAYRK